MRFLEGNVSFVFYFGENVTVGRARGICTMNQSFGFTRQTPALLQCAARGVSRARSRINFIAVCAAWCIR
jgi:hypothetical protein